MARRNRTAPARVVRAAAPSADAATVEITDSPASKSADAKIDRKAGAAQQEMQWIWSPAQPLEKNVPPGVCYFRKSFTIGQPESGEVQISCDNAYELFVNGRPVADGNNWRVMKSHDITKYLTFGPQHRRRSKPRSKSKAARAWWPAF